MKVGKFEIGKGKVFIIAELSANHNQQIEVAKDTIRAAKRCGADAVKLQTYTADTITLKSNQPDFVLNQGTIWDGKTLHDLYLEAFTPWEWHKELMDLAKELGLICFSSPFDKTAVDFLENLDVPAYKIASFEITDIPLIKYTASKGKPIIISTGIADANDIQMAVDACKSVGNDDIILLKTSSQYPAIIEDANMLMIPELARKYDVLAGLSDHTKELTVPMVATSLGATVIEKHIILDKSIGGPDASFSLDEAEFKEMVTAVREVEKSLGVIDFSLSEKAKISRQFSRSLYVCEDVQKGDVVNEQNVRSIRPGFGLHPVNFELVMGAEFINKVDKGSRLIWDDLKIKKD